MTQAVIPFAPNQQSGLEPLAGASSLAVNVVVEPNGVVRRRPGMVAYSTGPAVVDAAGIYGLHATVNGRVYAVGGTPNARTLYRLTNGIPATLSATTVGYLRGALRPIVAETEAMLAIAGGSDIQRIYLADDSTARLSSDAPLSSHVVANNSRLLGNDVFTDLAGIAYSSQAAGSATSPHEEWAISAASGAGIFYAEARPDSVVALAENSNEVFAFGPTSLQVYSPDPTFDYGPVATHEYGCIAPYSVVKVDKQFFWLDHLRRIVRSDGRSFEVMSVPIKPVMDAMAVVTDCFAYRVAIGAIDAVCFCFPTDGRTFVYQLGGGWAVWMGWSDTTNNFARLPVNAACANPATGQVLVGLTTGQVARMTPTAFTDLSDGRIVASVTSGYLARGTDARKHCKVVRVALRRGETVLSGNPEVLLSWRDDGGPWGAPMRVSLGASGEYDPVVELRSLGVYRRREWKVEFSGSEDFVLVAATEEFDVLSD